MNQSQGIKYPEGCYIEWCGETFKVIRNNDDCWGAVLDPSGFANKRFHFTYDGEEALRIDDKDKIKELDDVYENLYNKLNLDEDKLKATL